MEITDVKKKIADAKRSFENGIAKEQIQADLETLKMEAEQRLAEVQGKPEEKDWFQVRQDVSRAQTDVNLAGNSIHQTLKATGIGGKLETAMGWMGTVGNKVGEGAQVAWEYTLKPLWENVLKPLWDKVSGIFSGMSQGTKKSMASAMRFFGYEDWAKRLEGAPAGMTEQDQKDLREIRGRLQPGTLKSEKPAEDLDTLVKLRANQEALGREYPGLRTRYASLTGYLDQVIKEVIKPEKGKQYTLQQLAEATDTFNKMADKRNEEVTKEKANQPAPTAAPTAFVVQPAPTTTPAPAPVANGTSPTPTSTTR